MVPRDGEELVLALRGLLVAGADRRTMSRAVTCPLFFSDVNAAYPVPATSASETRHSSWSSQRACGYSMPVQAPSEMPAIALATEEFTGTVTEKRAPFRMTVLITAEL
jgi:hypothetical protein